MRRRALGIGLLVVVVAGALVGVTLWASSQMRGNVVRVPDMVGMTATAGQQLLKRLNLEYRVVGQRESEETEAGKVLSQDPAANEQVPPATVVKVVLSEGPKTVVVPNVTQMSVAQARKNLQAAGLDVGLVQEAYDDRIPAKYVASTLPTPGARVVRGTAVDIVESLGPRPSMPPGPPLPTTPKNVQRQEKLDFMVPSDVGPGDAKVTVEATDDKGTTTIYEGTHKAGESVPTQTITVRASMTVRVLVNGQVRAEHAYQP